MYSTDRKTISQICFRNFLALHVPRCELRALKSALFVVSTNLVTRCPKETRCLLARALHFYSAKLSISYFSPFLSSSVLIFLSLLTFYHWRVTSYFTSYEKHSLGRILLSADSSTLSIFLLHSAVSFFFLSFFVVHSFIQWINLYSLSCRYPASSLVSISSPLCFLLLVSSLL